MPSIDTSIHKRRLPAVPNSPATGFGEAQTGFQSGSGDAVAFNQKRDLVQHFSMIDSEAARQQVLDLARRLANE
jgi:hypothetical protein